MGFLNKNGLNLAHGLNHGLGSTMGYCQPWALVKPLSMFPNHSLRLRSHFASKYIVKRLVVYFILIKKGGTPIKPSFARCE